MNYNLTTPVALPATDIVLDTDSRVMLIGSCFAEHVGLCLQQRMGEGRVDVNPFGVLYNPLSIAQALEMLIDCEDISQIGDDYIFLGQDGVYHSWLHTSHFSGKERTECQQKIHDRFITARQNLKDANLLCVTFGTTRCYCLESERAPIAPAIFHSSLFTFHSSPKDEHRFVVANCHKEPQSRFHEYEPSIEEMQSVWGRVIEKLRAFNPRLRICFTVSPYRYRKYGFHESQIQKAKLLLLCDSLGCNYFPSYEILMDELRDYRFYAADMLHPSDVAVDIIAERFMDWTFTERMKQEAIVNYKKYKQTQHRRIV